MTAVDPVTGGGRMSAPAAPAPDVHADTDAAALFAGPGEMRRLCRAVDWAAHPLGPVGSWPAELRTAVRIIILTARGGDDAASEGLAAGPDDYITKPFSSRELLARVRSNHELHQLRERAVGVAENRAERIHTALDSNRVIGTAVGIPMADHQVTAALGFELLVKASQDGNRKFRDIAADVVGTGSLPFRQTTVDDLLQRVVGAGP